MDRDQLMASLLVGNEDDGGVAFDDDRYFDWSTEKKDGVGMEVSDGTDTAVVDLTWSEMERLQRALPLRLLQREQ